MKIKQVLVKFTYAVAAVLLALCCVTLGNVNIASAEETESSTETTSNIVELFKPTATDENYTVSGFSPWLEETKVIDYAASPTGKVVEHTIDSNGNITSEHWPSFKINTPYSGDTTGFAGYVVWLEYTATMEAEISQYGLFSMYINGVHFKGDGDITFINEKGKITETTTPKSYYHHNNATAIEGSEYTYAYTYAFKGYMILPKETYSAGDITPNTETYFNLTHHYKKNIVMDLKIGQIGFYTDYTALLGELGRCDYSFVDHDGTVIDSASVRPGTEIVAPEYENSFVKNGRIYTFIGWSNYTEGMTITSDLTFNANYKITDFKMVKGASVRLNSASSGIRFTAEFDENLYNEVSLDDNKQFGMLITKRAYYDQAVATEGDLIANLTALGGNKYALITESSSNPVKPYIVTEEAKTVYRINGALTNIQYKNADCEWIGVGVVITGSGENVSYLYAAHDVEDSTRTMSYIASAALNDPTEDFTSDEQTILKNYVYKTAAKLAGATETDYNAAPDKSEYISGYSLELGEGLTTYNIDGNEDVKEAYLTTGETKNIQAVVQNEDGDVLDVAFSLTVGDSSVLEANGTKLTVLKNGYSSLSLNCDLFGYAQTLNVYTGTTSAGTVQTNLNKITEAAAHDFNVSGEIGGQEYYGYYISRPGASSAYFNLNAAAYLTSYPKDISIYYIDYLISQGYKYVRIPFYVDTTMEHEKFDTGLEYEASTYTEIRVYVSATITGSSLQSRNYKVENDAWCYYDMDIHHYRANMTEANSSEVINEYGFKTAIKDSGYSYNNFITSAKNSVIYMGEFSFVKNSGFTLDVSNDTPSFGEEINLSEYYDTNGVAATYTVDGEKMNAMTAVFNSYNVNVSANVYTANIGDGTHVVGTPASWTVNGLDVAESVEKTMTVQNGLDFAGTVLVDVNGATTDVSVSDYTKSATLQANGFTVTQSYVKRYSEGETVTADTIANTERGIFYADVTAVKDTQEISYKVTLDIYNSSEPVEYETFGHTDSKYAVKAYYALLDRIASSSTILAGNKLSYQTISATYKTGAIVDGYNAYGTSIDFDTYFACYKYGDTSYDTESVANLRAVYGYADDYDLSNYTYLALDGSKITLEGPIVTSGEGGTQYNMDSTLNIYVTPRHSQAYYKMYSESTELLKFAVAAPGKVNADIAGGIKLYGRTGVNTLKYFMPYSGKWQTSIMTSNANGVQSITPATIADNYDVFANNEVPMYSWDRPQGRAANSAGLGLMKLGSLIF